MRVFSMCGLYSPSMQEGNVEEFHRNLSVLSFAALALLLLGLHWVQFQMLRAASIPDP